MYTKNLNELNKESLPEAGGKGANLGELIGAGLPVPTGFVVTTDAYRAFSEGKTVDVENAIKAAFKNMPSGPVAVRSSATAEDLPSASFAGQMETYLGIYGEDAVIENVKKCWDSLNSERAISYRKEGGFIDSEVSIAVVVQSMINADMAGVMFTANPVNGNGDEILISAGYGLGESVVSGLITPDTFVLGKNGKIKSETLGSKEIKIVLTETGAMEKTVPQADRKSFCLKTSELAQLTRLANAVEKHYGEPMDTEWAIADGKAYLLQARPITTMNDESEYLSPGTAKPSFLTKMIKNWFEEPLTPLDFACFGKRSMGLMKIVERENGCAAVKFAGLHVLPSVMGRFMGMFFGNLFKQTEDIWQPLSTETNAYLKKLEISVKNTNDSAKLVALLAGALDEFGNLFRKRLGILAAPGFGNDFKLDTSVREILGEDEANRTEEILLRALPFRTALQNDALVNLARTAAESGRESAAFSDALGRFLDEYGDRPAAHITAMPGAVTIRENPELISGLLDAFLFGDAYVHAEKNTQKQAEDFETAKKRIEAMLAPNKRHKFSESLEKSRNEIIIREESSFLIEKFTASIRGIALKLGSILAKKAIINETDDIFFLFLTELSSAIGGKPDMKDKIARRKKALAAVCVAHEKGVHWMVSTGSVAASEDAENRNDKNTADTFYGVSASRGIYEGTACIVGSPSEFGKLKKGDVMVAPFTSPVWTPLFKVAAAVVTEVGSPTSHAAIVAREYGIPCVVAVAGVTKLLTDGQKIKVDGANGTITILKEEHAHA